MRKFLYLILFTIAWLHTPVATAITAGIRIDQEATTKTGGYTVTDAQMQQWFFRPKLTTGMSHLKYEETDLDFKWSDNLPFVGIGATMYYGKLSGELYAQISDKGQADYFTSARFGSSTYTTVYDVDFKRTEYSALLSYEIFNNISIFGSYKVAELEVNRIDTQQVSRDNETTGTVYDPLTRKKSYTNFKTKGPALGIAYSYHISDDVGLGVSFAYGWLNGTRKQDNVASEPQPTTAQAYGINFTHRLPQHHLKYILALENYGYSMDVNEDVKGVNGIVTKTFQITEDVTSFKATLVWEF